MIFIVLILIAALVYFAVKSNDIGHEIKEIEKKNLQGLKASIIYIIMNMIFQI